MRTESLRDQLSPPTGASAPAVDGPGPLGGLQRLQPALNDVLDHLDGASLSALGSTNRALRAWVAPAYARNYGLGGIAHRPPPAPEDTLGWQRMLCEADALEARLGPPGRPPPLPPLHQTAERLAGGATVPVATCLQGLVHLRALQRANVDDPQAAAWHAALSVLQAQPEHVVPLVLAMMARPAAPPPAGAAGAPRASASRLELGASAAANLVPSPSSWLRSSAAVPQAEGLTEARQALYDAVRAWRLGEAALQVQTLEPGAALEPLAYVLAHQGVPPSLLAALCERAPGVWPVACVGAAAGGRRALLLAQLRLGEGAVPDAMWRETLADAAIVGAHSGHVELVRDLLRRGRRCMDVPSQQAVRARALYAACIAGRGSAVQGLMQHDLTTADVLPEATLMVVLRAAARVGRLDLFEPIATGIADETLYTSSHALLVELVQGANAARAQARVLPGAPLAPSGHLAVLAWLLALELFDVDGVADGGSGERCTHVAVHAESPAFVQKLWAHGANFAACDARGLSALEAIAGGMRPRTSGWLLERAPWLLPPVQRKLALVRGALANLHTPLQRRLERRCVRHFQVAAGSGFTADARTCAAELQALPDLKFAAIGWLLRSYSAAVLGVLAKPCCVPLLEALERLAEVLQEAPSEAELQAAQPAQHADAVLALATLLQPRIVPPVGVAQLQPRLMALPAPALQLLLDFLPTPAGAQYLAADGTARAGWEAIVAPLLARGQPFAQGG